MAVTKFTFFNGGLFGSVPVDVNTFACTEIAGMPVRGSLLTTLFKATLTPLIDRLSFGLNVNRPCNIFLKLNTNFISNFLVPPLTRRFIAFAEKFDLCGINFAYNVVKAIFVSLVHGFNFRVRAMGVLTDNCGNPFSILLCSLFDYVFLVNLRVGK